MRLLREPIKVKRVALVYSPILSGIPLLTAVEKAQQRPGLGLRYLKAVLIARGIEVDLFDNLHNTRGAQTVHKHLNVGNYDLIGFHTSSASRGHALTTISKLDPRYRGKVMAGGPGALHFEELLANGVDVVANGEGEETIPLIIDAYEGNTTFDQVPGIIFLDDDDNLVNTGAPIETDLAKLPFPNWDDHDPASGDMFNITLKRPFYVVMASRGCPHRCGFCASHQHWRLRYRPRPVENVIDEVEWLVNVHGARYIHFLDDIFGLTPGWVDAFCDLMEQRKIKLDFAVVVHPLTWGKDRRRLLGRLRKVGCRLASFGAQSAVPEILKGVRRSPAEPEALRDAVSACHEHGIVSVLTYIFGLPGDTPKTLRQTIDFVKEVRPTLVDFHPLLYLPGSEIADSMPEERFCKMTPEDINRWCTKAVFEYYALTGGAFRVLTTLLRQNPGWFGNIIPISQYALEYIGLIRDSRDTRRYL